MPATPDGPAIAPTVLAFDFGQRRIGVAFGQAVTASASPLGAVSNGEAGPDWARVERLIEEWRPAHLVVGLPLNTDGSESDLSKAATAFAADLDRFRLPVALVDERYSSLEAEQQLRTARSEGRRGKIQKADIDAAAAVIIAERWLAQNS